MWKSGHHSSRLSSFYFVVMLQNVFFQQGLFLLGYPWGLLIGAKTTKKTFELVFQKFPIFFSDKNNPITGLKPFSCERRLFCKKRFLFVKITFMVKNFPHGGRGAPPVKGVYSFLRAGADCKNLCSFKEEKQRGEEGDSAQHNYSWVE